MRVLVTGAYGFVGQHIANGLLSAGHEVYAYGRDLSLGKRILPGASWQRCDFNTDTNEECWLTRLKDVDAVVNCVGILQDTARDSHRRVHVDAPAALFRAAERLSIQRVIQISALGVEVDSGTPYSQSKSEADALLKELDLDWIVLKPSLLYARGSFGGTTLIRALAGVPFFTPLIQGGHHKFQPVSMDYLVRVVLRLLEPDAPARKEFVVSGPEPMTLAEIVRLIRRWLGFRNIPFISIPKTFARPMLWVGDVAGWLGLTTSFRSTALAQMELGNTGSPDPLIAATGLKPGSMESELQRHPSTLQDRLHARSAFAVALLRITIGIFWIVTGLMTLSQPLGAIGASFMGGSGLSETLIRLLVIFGAIADIALGLPFLIGWRIRQIGFLQLALSATYLAVLGFFLPFLWLDPLGPLLKVLPLMAATLIVMAWAEPR